MPESYSFSPQFATIRSESPLAGMRPAKAIHTALQFQPQKFLDIKSSQPELVSNAWASGLKEGIGDALKGITAAYVDERKSKAENLEKIAQRAHEVQVANIKAKKTTEDDVDTRYKEAQIKNIESLIKDRGDDKKKGKIKPAGSIPIVDVALEDMPLEAVEVPVKKAEPVKEIDFSLAPEGTENVTGEAPLTSMQVPPKKFSIPAPNLFDEEIAFEEYVPPQTQFDIAASAPPAEPVSKVTSPPAAQAEPLVSTKPPSFTPQELAKMAESRINAIEKANIVGDQMATEQPQVQAPSLTIQKMPTGDLIGDFASYEEAMAANDELQRRFPDYEIQDIASGVSDNGQQFFKVIPPKQSKVKAKAKDQIPEGFSIKSAKMKDGTMEYDLVPKPEVEAEIKALKQPMEGIEAMLAAIKDIKSIAGGWSPGVGGAGSILKFVPSSDAWNVDDLLKGLESNIAFKTLMDMKAASPTGGALGAVSERELELLAASLGSINQNLDYEYFMPNLERIEKNIIDTKNRINNKTNEILEKSGQKFIPLQPQAKQENLPVYTSPDQWNDPKSAKRFIFNGKTYTKP